LGKSYDSGLIGVGKKVGFGEVASIKPQKKNVWVLMWCKPKTAIDDTNGVLIELLV
jgi:hypothetical protein